MQHIPFVMTPAMRGTALVKKMPGILFAEPDVIPESIISYNGAESADADEFFKARLKKSDMISRNEADKSGGRLKCGFRLRTSGRVDRVF